MYTDFIDELENAAKLRRELADIKLHISSYEYDITKEMYEYLYPQGQGLQLRTGEIG